jgi:hypothetical protein
MVWMSAEPAGPRAVVCWGGGVRERKPYPSDLSDEQWSLIELVITAWKDRHRSVSGHQEAAAVDRLDGTCMVRTDGQRPGFADVVAVILGVFE